MKFSKFSDNFSSTSGILQLMDDLGRAHESDGPTYMLGGGNPAAIGPMEAVFRRELSALMEDGRRLENLFGKYDAPQGNRPFIDALTNFFRDQFGWPVTDQNIAITNGSQSSFGILFNLFSGSFDDHQERQILLPLAPEYIGYSDVGIGPQQRFKSIRPKIDHLEKERIFFKYKLDEGALNISDQFGAVCVSRPTNPTGNVISDSELQTLQHRCKETSIPLIIDGAYGLPFPGIVFCNASAVWNPDTILCLSLSKLGLPGLRTGIIVADEEVIRMIKSSSAILNLAPGGFGSALMTRLVQQQTLLEICRNTIAPYYLSKCQFAVGLIENQFSDLPVKIHQPEGAIFLWLWFDGLPISSDTLYQRLKSRGVYVISGHHFFPGMEDHWEHQYECIRVSYAADSVTVEQGIKIIAEEVRRAYDI